MLHNNNLFSTDLKKKTGVGWLGCIFNDHLIVEVKQLPTFATIGWVTPISIIVAI